MVYILIQIDNITFVNRNKVCTSANMPGLSGQCSNSLAVVIILFIIFDYNILVLSPQK